MEGTPKSLNYKIVQDSNINDDDQIEKYTGTVDWKYLEKHFQNGALVHVDEKLDIKKVANAVKIPRISGNNIIEKGINGLKISSNVREYEIQYKLEIK